MIQAHHVSVLPPFAAEHGDFTNFEVEAQGMTIYVRVMVD